MEGGCLSGRVNVVEPPAIGAHLGLVWALVGEHENVRMGHQDLTAFVLPGEEAPVFQGFEGGVADELHVRSWDIVDDEGGPVAGGLLELHDSVQTVSAFALQNTGLVVMDEVASEGGLPDVAGCLPEPEDGAVIRITRE